VPVVHALLELYQQVLTHIEAHSKEEFQDICTEYGLSDKLAAIEQLCARDRELDAGTQSAPRYIQKSNVSSTPKQSCSY
jgi:hypothetical protein